ncbi:MAG TPA: exopolysaccharide biosynthesis polyprenyl glycosylphosphotransferase, partial [Puia sp.]|nr:exopolysaccharide biosynthesis polyprenyl glycosylphosphotransferase [Puia sp.]
MTSRYTSLFRFSFASADLIVLNLVHLVLMNSLRRLPANSGPEYLLLFIVANILWLISAYASGLYIEQGNPNYMRFIKRTVKCLISFFLLMALFIFFNHYPYSRIFVVISFLGFAVLLVAMRLLMMEASVYAGKNGKAGKRVVIIGYNELAVKLAKRFSEDGSISSVEGYFEDKERVGELSLLPIIGNIDECLQYAVNNNINEIYSTISPERNYSIYEMAYRAEKALIRFKFVPDFKLYVNRNTHMEYIDQFPVLSLRPEPLEDVTNSIKKRIFDMAFSAMVIVFVLSWLVPVLAILIKLNSRGPVFFVQWRSGKGNKKFKCYKFRSLSVNADANVKQVTLNDSRVTPLGRFLRKTNLDELPQFFNVFKGDMSVIGPRPHMLLHTDIFSRITEQYMIRHFVKPGVTGWAQINGYRGEIKEESQLRKRI